MKLRMRTLLGLPTSLLVVGFATIQVAHAQTFSSSFLDPTTQYVTENGDAPGMFTTGGEGAYENYQTKGGATKSIATAASPIATYTDLPSIDSVELTFLNPAVQIPPGTQADFDIDVNKILVGSITLDTGGLYTLTNPDGTVVKQAATAISASSLASANPGIPGSLDFVFSQFGTIAEDPNDSYTVSLLDTDNTTPVSPTNPVTTSPTSAASSSATSNSPIKSQQGAYNIQFNQGTVTLSNLTTPIDPNNGNDQHHHHHDPVTPEPSPIIAILLGAVVLATLAMNVRRKPTFLPTPLSA